MTRKKNILFLSYWSLREPLTAAAIFPYLKILSERSDVDQIHLVTIETTSGFLPEVKLDLEKVTHHAIVPRMKWSYYLSKIHLQLKAIVWLLKFVRKNSIDLIFAKASMAGAIVHVIHWLTGIPYIVESYEPHSVYMLECGVWSRKSLRYRFAHYMEKLQLRNAEYIITVTHNHREDLIAEGSDPDRIKVIPSITDLNEFQPKERDRSRIRAKFSIPMESTVGIYVGKFGGLYFDEEAYEIFSRAIGHFKDLHLIVLSPADPQHIRERAELAGIPSDRFHVLMAPHVEVPAYLSAADFAFSTIKPSPIKRYQCPIKNGEYWANGLPILMTDGIADEHRLMRKGIGGSVFQGDLSDLDEALEVIEEILADPDHKAQIIALAAKYKSIDIAKAIYEEIL